MPLTARQHERTHNQTLALPMYQVSEAEVPIDALAANGMGTETAYEVLRAELLLDGQSRLNLATFVTTWMPALGSRLMAETADKNMIDKDEYPRTADLEQRCVSMLSHLWHSPEDEEATGTSTTGSSEAAMLAGMALKWRWRERRGDAGKSADKPNLVMGANVQVCWEKFANYWDVEMRLVPMEGNRFHLGAEEAAERSRDRAGRDSPRRPGRGRHGVCGVRRGHGAPSVSRVNSWLT